jgi:tetratricopeptide (TPR) repeat protein
MDWQRALGSSGMKIGDVLVRNTISPVRSPPIATASPSPRRWRRRTRQDAAAGDLAVVGMKIGDVLVTQHDLTGALTAYRDSLAITKTMAQKDPTNSQRQIEVAVANIKISDVLQVRGDFVDALAAYRDIVAIFKALARQDPKNTEWQRNLAGSYAHVGLIASQQNDFSAARDAFEQAKEIALQLRRSIRQAPPLVPTSHG